MFVIFVRRHLRKRATWMSILQENITISPTLVTIVTKHLTQKLTCIATSKVFITYSKFFVRQLFSQYVGEDLNKRWKARPKNVTRIPTVWNPTNLDTTQACYCSLRPIWAAVLVKCRFSEYFTMFLSWPFTFYLNPDPTYCALCI